MITKTLTRLLDRLELDELQAVARYIKRLIEAHEQPAQDKISQSNPQPLEARYLCLCGPESPRIQHRQKYLASSIVKNNYARSGNEKGNCPKTKDAKEVR